MTADTGVIPELAMMYFLTILPILIVIGFIIILFFIINVLVNALIIVIIFFETLIVFIKMIYDDIRHRRFEDSRGRRPPQKRNGPGGGKAREPSGDHR